jgi:hypothetical protein
MSYGIHQAWTKPEFSQMFDSGNEAARDINATV